MLCDVTNQLVKPKTSPLSCHAGPHTITNKFPLQSKNSRGKLSSPPCIHDNGADERDRTVYALSAALCTVPWVPGAEKQSYLPIVEEKSMDLQEFIDHCVARRIISRRNGTKALDLPNRTTKHGNEAVSPINDGSGTTMYTIKLSSYAQKQSYLLVGEENKANQSKCLDEILKQSAELLPQTVDRSSKGVIQVQLAFPSDLHSLSFSLGGEKTNPSSLQSKQFNYTRMSDQGMPPRIWYVFDGHMKQRLEITSQNGFRYWPKEPLAPFPLKKRLLIAKRYIMAKDCIGSGGYGNVYPGRDLETDLQVAIKTEPKNEPNLALEKKIYDFMWRLYPELVGYPKAYWQGKYEDKSVLVMDRLGKSLFRHMKACGGRFSAKTVLMIGIQALGRLESLHNADHIHRDVKPDNMMTGWDDQNTIYFVDLGLAKLYRHAESKKHSKIRRGQLVGTLMYMSTNVHRRMEASRRDDLESLAYSLIYMYNGRLPWQGCEEANCIGMDSEGQKVLREYKEYNIGRQKANISAERLCDGMPIQMVEFFRRVKSMEFAEMPDYAGLAQLFEDALEQYGLNYDMKFDWEE